MSFTKGLVRGPVNFSVFGVWPNDNKLPFYEVGIAVNEQFDYEAQTWRPRTDAPAEVRSRLTLFAKNGDELFSYAQIKDALGWDGESFAALDESLVGKVIQAYVQEDTYNNRLSLKIKRVAKENADPFVTAPLDPADIVDLNKRFLKGNKRDVFKNSVPVAPPPPIRSGSPTTPPVSIQKFADKDAAWEYLTTKFAPGGDTRTLETAWIKNGALVPANSEGDWTPFINAVNRELFPA